MNYISLFSGIEAASCAWEPLGFAPVAFSEIEPFPSAVLKHHYPNVPNLGDIINIDWRPYHGSVDIVVGGSPCQSFSIAGNRAGLHDPRGNLMFEYLRAVDEIAPKWICWENVPGVFSIDKGQAFADLISGLDELGYSLAWRVLDAQFFGVPQRRKRVFIIGHLGEWRSSPAVLFEQKSLSGLATPVYKKREISAGDFGNDTALSIVGNIIGRDESNGGNGVGVSKDVAYTLTSTDIHATLDCRNLKVNENVSGTLQSKSSGGYSLNYINPVISFSHTASGTRGFAANVEVAPTLVSNGKTHTVCLADDCSNAAIDFDISGTLKVGGMPPAVINTDQDRILRRFTPKECERLQGFPDNYTLIKYRNKPASDTVRYKALGNSMAVPVMRWIGEGIQTVERFQNEHSFARKSAR